MNIVFKNCAKQARHAGLFLLVIGSMFVSFGAHSKAIDPNPFPSTYQSREHADTVVTNVHVLTAQVTGNEREFENGWVALSGGKIVGLGWWRS